jgi:hypothetical protein
MTAATTGDGAKSPSLVVSECEVILRCVTVIAGVVVALTFMFGFGNVFNLALRLGVPVWVAPLVAPAVDLSIVGLLLGTRHLALTGASAEVLRPARRLLIFASVVTLALNVADPLVAGEYGRAAFDSVGPLLLIGWSEVGPGLLQAISSTGSSTVSDGDDRRNVQVLAATSMVSGSSSPREGWRCGGVVGKLLVATRQRCCWNGHGKRTRLTGYELRSPYQPMLCVPG